MQSQLHPLCAFPNMASTLISISPKLFSRSIAAYRDRTARITEYRCLARTADSAHIVSGIVLYRACIARISFESIRKGIRPKAPFHNFESIANIADSLYIVEVATAADECIPCEANPFNLICRCKICRKTGMCKHALLTTHIIMASRGPEEAAGDETTETRSRGTTWADRRKPASRSRLRPSASRASSLGVVSSCGTLGISVCGLRSCVRTPRPANPARRSRQYVNETSHFRIDGAAGPPSTERARSTQ